MVEIPPKLITNVQATTESAPCMLVEISRQPFVISIIPSSTHDICGGKRLNIGDSEVMTTKNIAIIVPTVIILKAESITMVERF